jgi:hypothetical protein
MKRVLVMAALLTCASAAMANLAAYWNFEEGTGLTAADASGSGQHAYLQSADDSSYPQWTAGHIGINTNWPADPNGMNYLAIDPNDTPDDPNVLELGDAFTISMWVRRDALSGDWAYLVFADAYDLELAIDPSGVGDPYDYFWSEANSTWHYDIGIGTEDQQLGSWYHLAITCDNQILKKYVNGEQVYSIYVSPTVNLPKATTPLYIASRAGNDRAFTGVLDDVAFWAGSYLPAEEVAKLANQTATPLTVVDAAPLEPIIFVKETDLAWSTGGWKLFWDPAFNWDTSVSNNSIYPWWFSSPLTGPGARVTVDGLEGTGYCKWRARNEADYSIASRDVTRYGMEWIDPAWTAREPNNMAVLAAYITPGILLCQEGHGYQPYRPELYPWEHKNFFKTYARIAAVNAQNATLRIRMYTYTSEDAWTDPNLLTPFDEVYWRLDMVGDYVWKEYKHAFPKPAGGTPSIWFELGIVGGNANTMVYIDEFNPVSNFPNNHSQTGGYDSPPFVTIYNAGDMDEDSYVDLDDVILFSGDWLNNNDIEEPRTGGMLVNGDFFADLSLLDITEAEPAFAATPTGWTFSGSGTGAHGIHYMGNRGFINSFFSGSVMIKTPLGGSVAAYTKDPAISLEQTATGMAVSGQTYYAMGYVMTRGYINGFDDWAGYNDTATLSIEINGTEAAAFARPLSRERWRPVYGTYTATPADAGKPITVRFTYDNTATPTGWPNPGYMYVGYAYLGNTIPAEWPEERDNLLTNGGFEDLSIIESTPAYDSITTSDNGGVWFPNSLVPTAPAPTGWLYEVPSGFFNPVTDPNVAGIRASGTHGSPLPTPGLHDVTMYTSEGLTLGQIVGPLANGTTYYLDMACGVCIEPTWWGSFSQTWPSPAPSLHLELWRIPAGVTDGAVIYAAIAGGNPNYVRIVDVNEISVGDIKGGAGGKTVPPTSRWQLVGTTYTAAASDTNVYVRVYGDNEVTDAQVVHPTFAFSDVYLSTQKRIVPGGDMTFEIAEGMQYDTSGPYTCYHAALMGFEPPQADLNGDCMVNLNDLEIFAVNWLQNWFTNIASSAPWE